MFITSIIRHTQSTLVTVSQTCILPISSKLQKRETNMHKKDARINVFHQKHINLSTSKRGNVHRTNIFTATSPNNLNINQKTPHMIPEVQVASSNPPIF